MHADWQNVTFSNNQEIESLSATNYAFCQVRELNFLAYAVNCLENSTSRVIVFKNTSRLLAAKFYLGKCH